VRHINIQIYIQWQSVDKSLALEISDSNSNETGGSLKIQYKYMTEIRKNIFKMNKFGKTTSGVRDSKCQLY